MVFAVLEFFSMNLTTSQLDSGGEGATRVQIFGCVEAGGREKYKQKRINLSDLHITCALVCIFTSCLWLIQCGRL